MDKGAVMQKSLIAALAVLALAAASGCNQAKSPDAVANDVAAAQAKRAAQVADAKRDAEKDANKAEAKVEDKANDLDKVNAQGAYDVAMTQADGDHKVATQRCEAMSG